MASAAITITEQPATIESDTSEAVITKDTSFVNMQGKLINMGSEDVYLSVSRSGTPDSVATTLAQAQKQYPLPAGATFLWLKHYEQVAHKTAAGTATLAWMPDHEKAR